MSDPLFRPFTAGALSLRNRIVMAPMGQGKAVAGLPDERYVDYFRARAEGETGLIISGTAAIDHPLAPLDENEPHLHGSALPTWGKVVAAVHACGGHIMPQLGHAGLQGLAPAPPPWNGFGPSGLWMQGAQIGTEPVSEVRGAPMTLAQIEEVIAAFVRGSEAAKALGFDGVEIHGAHGFLIDQFLWAHTNRREDHYGAERSRFAAEIVSACRRAVGPDFPILFRFSQFKMTDYAARLAETPADLEAVLRPLVDAGVTLFDCSQRRFWRPEFDGSSLNLAGWVKKMSGRPTMGGGGIGLEKTSLEYGETGVYMHVASASTAHLDDVRDRLDRGEFDLVTVGRAILGDPQWAHKVRTGATDTLQPYGPEVLAW